MKGAPAPASPRCRLSLPAASFWGDVNVSARPSRPPSRLLRRTPARPPARRARHSRDTGPPPHTNLATVSPARRGLRAPRRADRLVDRFSPNWGASPRTFAWGNLVARLGRPAESWDAGCRAAPQYLRATACGADLCLAFFRRSSPARRWRAPNRRYHVTLSYPRLEVSALVRRGPGVASAKLDAGLGREPGVRPRRPPPSRPVVRWDHESRAPRPVRDLSPSEARRNFGRSPISATV